MKLELAPHHPIPPFPPALRCVAADKGAFVKLHKSGAVRQFKKTVFPNGHRQTDYEKWDDADAPYPVTYKNQYEPWFIAHWDALPW